VNHAAFWAGSSPDARTRYTDLVVAGQGAYSVVASAMDEVSGERVAIKRIAEVFYDAHEAKKVLREIRLLRDFCHPHIISLRSLIYPASIETFEDIFMVTDFMDGDLRRRIKSKRTMEAEQVRSYMAQLLAALAHVHAINGIHRDLKPANILIKSNGLLKLCDFGLARTAFAEQMTKRESRAGTEVDDGEEDGPSQHDSSKPPKLKKQMTTYVVTRWYRPPEVILQEPYSAAIDLWSAGCIFKELIELQPGSKFRTGALFPGRHCIPFSFDGDDINRTRHDQLNVIFRTLAPPTKDDFCWASSEAQAEVENLCGGWNGLERDERAAQIRGKLSEAVGDAGPVEIELLSAMLDLNPRRRPLAAQVLMTHGYFAGIPEAERPPLTPPADLAQVDAAFAFESETLGINDLRILIANDIFRMHEQDMRERESQRG